MEKISGILRGSPRVTSVDLKSARPVRPGTPSFGSPEGESSLRSQINRSTTTQQNPGAIEVPRWRAKEDSHVAIVNQIASGFFQRQAQPSSRNVLISDRFAEADLGTMPTSNPYMDVIVDDAIAEKNNQTGEFEGKLNEISDTTKSQELVEEHGNKMSMVANRGAAYFNPESDSGLADEGSILDTVA